MGQFDIIKHQFKWTEQTYYIAKYEQIKISIKFIHATEVFDSEKTH
jgi:hypothetical protein